MVFVGEDLVLQGQKCSTGIDEIETGQVIFFGDLLGAEMFFDSQRIVGAALDGGIVGDDHDFAPRNAPDARDETCACGCPIVHILCGEGGEFEEGCAGIEQARDALADEEFALFLLTSSVFGTAALLGFDEVAMQLVS